jgi:hypothetical protein
MNKLKIFIFFLFLIIPSFALAAVNIQFQSEPLFSDANFLPGNTVTRWVKVTNNTDQTQRIATEAINSSGNDLSVSLNLTIKEDGSFVLYSDTLFNFYNIGEKHLSDIPSGGSKEYDFEISFPVGSGNEWQGKTTSFDINVGFLQDQIQQQTYGSPGEGGGGGGGGLIIDEGNGGGGGGAGGEPEVKGAYTEKPIPPAPDNEPGKKDTSKNVLNLPNMNEIIPNLTASLGDALNIPNDCCWILTVLLIIVILLLVYIVFRKKN